MLNLRLMIFQTLFWIMRFAKIKWRTIFVTESVNIKSFLHFYSKLPYFVCKRNADLLFCSCMKIVTAEELQTYLIGLCDLKTQKKVAEEFELSPTYINELCKGTRPINSTVAGKLGYKMKITFEPVDETLDISANL